jgi:hypothetical protein
MILGIIMNLILKEKKKPVAPQTVAEPETKQSEAK